MPIALSPQQLVFLVILAAAVLLLVTERIRNDLVAVLVVVALSATQLLDPHEALSGFGSEPAIVVAGIFVLSAALHQTGLADLFGGWMARLSGKSYARALAVLMPSVAIASAFTHHLTTTAVMLPVTLTMARERDLAPSKLLMPLSFAASLGTTITILGAPAFLIASAVLQQAGRPGLSIFSIAPIGLALSAAGTLFMLTVGRFLLPNRKSGKDESAAHLRLDRYFTELRIAPESPFLGRTAKAVEEDSRYDFEVVGWIRQGRQLERPFGEQRLAEGDVLLVRTTPEEIAGSEEERAVELQPAQRYPAEESGDGAADGGSRERLVQAVVAPQAELAGRTIREVQFHRHYDAVVLGLWRRDGWLERPLAEIRLRPGDVLVLRGDEDALARVAEDRSFLILVPFESEPRPRQKAPVAGAIMLATIAAAAFGWLSIEMAALAGAVAMVLTRCLNLRQAYRAIDARIYVFIAGALPLGAAMLSSGTADLLAGWLQQAVGGWPEMLVLLAVFSIVAVLTQFMSDAATTALFGPVAVALAQALGQPPEPYVVTVAMAAVASFLTPDRASRQPAGVWAGRLPLRGLRTRRYAADDRGRVDRVIPGAAALAQLASSRSRAQGYLAISSTLIMVPRTRMP